MKNCEIEAWKTDDFRVDYTNKYMDEECPKLFDRLKEMSEVDIILNENIGLLKSLPINVSNFCLVFDQIKLSQRYLVEMVLCLRRMGFDIQIEEVRWCNIMDSCENICGDKGFYAVFFKYK